jgi:hypothetical protein
MTKANATIKRRFRAILSAIAFVLIGVSLRPAPAEAESAQELAAIRPAVDRALVFLEQDAASGAQSTIVLPATMER